MSEPGIIKKLDEVVVNRIAAGEIVQRPANALKELIENSLDAKATSISVTVKAGGLKYLQIQDNGTGIRSDNLDIVCERFTTSKLSQYEDLKEIATYGFRGEALASISHIAHLTILTKTAADKCAYKASYENGKLKGPIKACAGNTGTQVTVEDLFYNVRARRAALRRPREEHALVAEVLGSYAVHNHQVGFTLKKFGESTDIKTPANSSVVENVRIIYGNAIARELIPLEGSEPRLGLALRGDVTNLNYSHRRPTLLLFINNRLVDSLAIRKAVESIYSTYLPKNAHPFVYLSIELDPRSVDVNVHPTKHEVQFLNEEQIIDFTKRRLDAALLARAASRALYTQARLPGATMVEEVVKKTTDGTKIYAHNLVRVSADTQKIDKFFTTVHKTSETTVQEKVAAVNDDNGGITEDNCANYKGGVASQENKSINEEYDTRIPEIVPNEMDDSINIEASQNDSPRNARTLNLHTDKNIEFIDPKESFKTRKFKYERVETKLTSVKQLRMEVESSCNSNLREILANLIFIGCIDVHRSLIQHSTKLYLCDTRRITEELFYETLLYDFQNLGELRLSAALPLAPLLARGLRSLHPWDEQLGDMEEMAQQMSELLTSKRAMLYEYFSMEISENGELLALPLLLDGHTPYLGALPTFLVRLAAEVPWAAERACLAALSRRAAAFYSLPDAGHDRETLNNHYWKIEHVIFPAVRRFFLPPNCFVTNGALLQIASLSDLYKVFERC